ncbi:MAG: hypothetical protein V3S11_05425, partial [Elusimicrobiota bacterium]
MGSALEQSQDIVGKGPAVYHGEVVYIHAFDVAYEMIREPGRELLGQPVVQFVAEISKHHPEQLMFYLPKMIHMPEVERIGPDGSVRIQRTVKILPIGALSITVRVPFKAASLEELIAFHNLRFSRGSLYDEVRELAAQVRRELAPCYKQPVETIRDEEDYTVFCIASELTNATGEPIAAPEWLKENRRAVKALLSEEKRPERISKQAIDEVCDKAVSYYDRDVVVLDWDAALIADEPKSFDEVLHIMELATVQLVELEAYDRNLDEALNDSYRDIAESRLGKRRLISELSEIRIDMARLSDEVQNISKFFGDWHLARLYQRISERFHLSDWNRAIFQKLKTVSELYEMLKHDRENRWMLILEAMIVGLFIMDLVLIFMMG